MPKKLPKKFQQYFWDVTSKNIHPSADKNFVIQRLLDKGDSETVKWVTKNFAPEEIKETFRKLRDFSPRIANFWRLSLNIPKAEVLCLQKPYLSGRRSHWPF